MYRTVCNLNKLFGKLFESDVEALNEIADTLLNTVSFTYTLAETMKLGRSSRSSLFAKLNFVDGLNFPQMTKKDLTIFFAGTYQL